MKGVIPLRKSKWKLLDYYLTFTGLDAIFTRKSGLCLCLQPAVLAYKLAKVTVPAPRPRGVPEASGLLCVICLVVI